MKTIPVQCTAFYASCSDKIVYYHPGSVMYIERNSVPLTLSNKIHVYLHFTGKKKREMMSIDLTSLAAYILIDIPRHALHDVCSLFKKRLLK